VYYKKVAIARVTGCLWSVQYFLISREYTMYRITIEHDQFPLSNRGNLVKYMLKASYNALKFKVNMNLWGLNENFVIYYY